MPFPMFPPRSAPELDSPQTTRTPLCGRHIRNKELSGAVTAHRRRRLHSWRLQRGTLAAAQTAEPMARSFRPSYGGLTQEPPLILRELRTTASLTLLGFGVGFGTGYAAGRVRPLRRLGDAFDDAVRWARRQPARPQRGRRIQHGAAWVLIWTEVMLVAVFVPRDTIRNVRRIRASHAYSRQMPPEVTEAAIAAVTAHRPHDADRFTSLRVHVFPAGGHDLSNVLLLGADMPRTYLGLGNHKSSGLGEGVDPAALTASTERLEEVLTALRPPAGVLTIPLKHG